ncbi:DNA cytosine methyltransferase [Lysinibacillus xylanilyticus]|uniref:DNA cytosine methyltransferase n=1 Tax=Lysinibacillus xylanilyticus TaxID=582475 RepID=UPI002B24BE78|nr:DNA cytosine methyltransferase [Lysinibacillus xylanilyticus]MEB2300437.1 DNA cytosine methyltransferase [Lysinibacillus xylanilyticus]
MNKLKILDLFAGCGGLDDGFLQTGHFETVAAVEWLKPQVDTLRKRLNDKWNKKDADEIVMHFDIQRENELFSGWQSDEDFGDHAGLDSLVHQKNGIDVVIGGPPCQAYSIAGRVRDENGMKDDYRNYLFEHYLHVVERYQPKIFIFENVPGMLSAQPGDTPVTELIKEGFSSIGYEIINDLKQYTKIDASDYGVPQSRKRVILIGINRSIFNHIDIQEALKSFYTEILPKYHVPKKLTVREAIGDLPTFQPLHDEESHKKKSAYKLLNSTPVNITWHEARYHNLRDMEIYKMLAADIETGENKYINSKELSKIYQERVGSHSPIHRYHVLRPDQPSTTIIAHLYKDGNRFIHYDSKQSRSITPREAARLQSFDDDFDFCGSRGAVYQMIGNAVPPLLAKKIALAVYDFLNLTK